MRLPYATDTSAGKDRQWLLALAVSLLFGLELQFAGRLGFYADDFMKAADVLLGGPEAGGFWQRAGFHVLSDEPLFNLYHNLRFLILGVEGAWPHHVLQGSLHVLNGVLVFQLVRRLTGELGPAWATLLLFVGFPGLGQALFWTSAIYVLLLTLLLGALHCWLSWLQTDSRAMLIASVALCAAAVFTHETAFFFWGVFAAIFVWKAETPLRDRGWRRLALLAGVNLAYLAIRQTDWFGWGHFSNAVHRPLSLASAPELAFASVNLNLGPWLWVRIGEMLPYASKLDAARACAAGLSCALIPALSLRPRNVAVKTTLLWFFCPAVLVAGCGWALGAALGQRVFTAALFLTGGWALLRGGRVRFCVLGGVWFSLAFAPAYLYYIAFRHSYLPAVGAAMALAALFCAVASLPYRHASAVGWGLLGTVVAWWHLACLGETRQWIASADELRRVEAQVKAIDPAPQERQYVVLLGVDPARNKNPIFDQPTVKRALPLWLGMSGLRASRYFEPHEDGFRAQRDGPLIPYEALRLFQYADGVIEERRQVELPGGRTIELAAARAGAGS